MKVQSRSRASTIIKETLKQFPKLSTVILYGSAAEDSLSDSSDIDLAVASSEKLSNENLLTLSLKLGEQLEREVSVINMNKMEGVILQQVLDKGIRLKNSDPLLLSEYIIKMYDFSEDILPFQMQTIESKLKDYIRG